MIFDVDILREAIERLRRSRSAAARRALAQLKVRYPLPPEMAR